MSSWQRATEVLRENDLGGWTKAAPQLYPHQWSWDSAFGSGGARHCSIATVVSREQTDSYDAGSCSFAILLAKSL